MQMYEEIDYARGRLAGTIVTRKMAGKIKAVKVNDLGEVAHVTILSSGAQDLCDPKELDITPVTLGYINTKTTAAYMTRAPMREDWRQGLRPTSMRLVKMGEDEGRLRIPEREPENKALADCIENIYPPYIQTLHKVQNDDKIRSQAFSREFAVNHNMEILYKEFAVVGKVIDVRKGVVDFLPEYEWVRESFQEVVNVRA